MKRIAICGLLIALVLALFAPGAIASDPSTAAGAYTSSGAAAAGTNYYLADGYSGYDVWVAVRDVSGVHNNIRCYVYYGSQQFYLTNVAEANSRCTFHVNPYLPANTSFSMKVVGLNGSIVAERSMYAGGDGSCGSGAVYLRNSQDPNPYYFFSDVYSETGANAYIEVFNRNPVMQEHHSHCIHHRGQMAGVSLIRSICRFLQFPTRDCHFHMQAVPQRR